MLVDSKMRIERFEILHMHRGVFQGHKFTIKWEGVLADKSGNSDTWIGVEWDDASRGKHNGEYKGQKLFEVSVPNSGSFLRKSVVEFGTTISKEIEGRVFPGGSLSLAGSLIENIGTIDSFPKEAKIINVADSLVYSFQFIWDLLTISNQIQSLIIGRCHFIEFPPPPNGTTFSLEELVLNDTNLNPDQLFLLLNSFSSIQSIDISYNTIPPLSLFTKIPSYTKLQILHLDGLKINDFSCVYEDIGKLPELKELSLNHNEISLIPVPNSPIFQKLEILSLKNNKIPTIFSLDGILNFPLLSKLNIQRNPIQETIGEIETRLLMIGRFNQLTYLNGSEIKEQEKMESEIHYLTYFAKEVSKGGKIKHPRWDDLVKRYGAPGIAEEKTDQKKKVKVKFIYGEKIIDKVIPLSMKVGTLCSLVGKLFKEDTELEIGLETGGYKNRLRFPEQRLNEVGIGEESVIYVGKMDDHIFDEKPMAHDFKIRSLAAQLDEGN